MNISTEELDKVLQAPIKRRKETANTGQLDIVERVTSILEEDGFVIRKNELTDCIEVNGVQMTDSTLSELKLIGLSKGIKRDDIQDCINVIAQHNAYHPMKAYFNSLPSNESQMAIGTFLDCLDVKDGDLVKPILLKWLVGIVARVFENTQNIVPILEGAQGIGKSTLVKWLSPNASWSTDTQSKFNTSDKDNQLMLAQMLIWELSEFEHITSKHDASELKEFITKQSINVRSAYARYAVQRKPIASFLATTNADTYFNDVTGNRRFLPVVVNSIDIAYQNINKNDLWSELVTLYLNDFDRTLTTEEKAYQTEANEAKMIQEPLLDILNSLVNNKEGAFTSTAKLYDMLRMNGINGMLFSRKVGQTMKRLGFEQIVKKFNGKTTRGYANCTPIDEDDSIPDGLYDS